VRESYLNFRFKNLIPPSHPFVQQKNTGSVSVGRNEFSVEVSLEPSTHGFSDSESHTPSVSGGREVSLEPSTPEHDSGISGFLSKVRESYLNFRFKNLIPLCHPFVQQKHTGSVSVGRNEFSVEVSLEPSTHGFSDSESHTPSVSGGREVSLEPSTLEHDNGFSEFHTPLTESQSPLYVTPFSNPGSQDRVSPSVSARKVLTFSDEVDEDMTTTTTTVVHQRPNPMEEEDGDDKTEEGIDTQGHDSPSDVAALGDNVAVSTDFTDMEMASLLDMFVPTELNIPIQELMDKKWLREKDFNQIRLTFEQRFGHLTPSACGLLRMDSQAPEGMVRINSLVKPYIETIKHQRDVLNGVIRLGQDTGRASTLAENQFREVQMGEKLPIIKSISLLLGRRATELAHDGTSTYAEPTQAGIIKVAEKLRELMGPNRKDQMLIDCGSGVGTALWIMCQVLDCKGLGLEYSTNRVFTGCARTSQLLDKYESNPAFEFRVANMHGDLHALRNLYEGLVGAYQYDEAFGPALMEDTLEMYKNAPLTFRFVVCAKSQRSPAYGKEMFEEYGLYPLTSPIACKKVGSGEASSFVIFGRRCCDYSDLPGKVLEPPETTTPYPMPARDCKPTPLPVEVVRILDGDMEAAKQHYKNLFKDMKDLMSIKRPRKQSQHVHCTSWEQFEHCGDKVCQSCESAFQHTDVRELYAQPVPWLPGQNGLFTLQKLEGCRYVIEYIGKKSTRSLKGSYVLEVSAGCFVDARGRGLQQYINHSCDANCIFQKWNDSRGRLRISIATRRAIKKDEELTVDYGSAREDFVCECRACTKFTKTILLLGMTGLSEPYIKQRLNIREPLNANNMCKAMLKMGNKVDQQLRDSLRLQLLRQDGWRPYTISLEPVDHGGKANSHFSNDWNRMTLFKELKAMHITVDIVELDYTWMPNSYTSTKARPVFYQQTLPKLGAFVRDGGSIFLPAQVGMLDGLLSNKESWEPAFELHLLGETERKAQCPLFAGMKCLAKLVGKDNVDAALAKNCAENAKVYTHIALKTLGGASVESQQLCKAKGLPVCLLKLKRKSATKPIPSPSPGTKTSRRVRSQSTPSNRRKRPSGMDLKPTSKKARSAPSMSASRLHPESSIA
jgi:hypothetical protein